MTHSGGRTANGRCGAAVPRGTPLRETRSSLRRAVGNLAAAATLQHPLCRTPAAAASGFPDWLPAVLGTDPIWLDPQRDCPFHIDYQDGLPGQDRLAAALTCHHRDPGGSWIIVDAGTCITVDLLSPGRWRGGAILPGLALQARAMAGAGLPVLKRSQDGWPCRDGAEGALGRTTEEALEAGIPWASRASVTAVIRALTDIDPCAQVVLTGGDAAHFDGIGGWQTFADPKLVLTGTALLLNATTS